MIILLFVANLETENGISLGGEPRIEKALWLHARGRRIISNKFVVGDLMPVLTTDPAGENNHTAELRRLVWTMPRYISEHRRQRAYRVGDKTN